MNNAANKKLFDCETSRKMVANVGISLESPNPKPSIGMRGIKRRDINVVKTKNKIIRIGKKSIVFCTLALGRSALL